MSVTAPTKPQLVAKVEGKTGESRYGRLKVVGDAGSQTLTLNGKMALRSIDVNGDTLSLRSALMEKADDLISVEVIAGSACPYQYVVMQIGPGGASHASAPFGTCGLLSSAQLDDGRLIMDMRGWRSTGSPVAATRYIYSGGRVVDTPLKSRGDA